MSPSSRIQTRFIHFWAFDCSYAYDLWGISSLDS